MRRAYAFLLTVVTALLVSVTTSLVTPLVRPTFNPNWVSDAATIASSELLIGAGSSTISATGPFYNPWKTFTPTGSFLTNVTYQGVATRTGNVATFFVTLTFTNTTTAANFTLDLSSLPYTFDQSALDAGGTTSSVAVALCASGRFSDTGTSVRGNLEVEYSNATVIGFRICSTSPNTFGAVSNTVPFTFNNTDYFSFVFRAPVVQ